MEPDQDRHFDQDRQNVGPDLGPYHLTLIVVLKEFFEKVNFGKKSASENLPSIQRVNIDSFLGSLL